MKITRILPFALLIGMAAALAQTAAPEHKGKFERIKVHGKSLEGNLSSDSADRDVSVYLPPSYSKEKKRRYPVVYMLHGFTDSDDRWFGLRGQHFINVPVAVDKAFAAGVPEMILVMPNAFTTFQGSMYSNSATTGDWEGYVTQDLVSCIDSHYRTIPDRASRGLTGHSMGGYGTVRIGMKSPEIFSSFYAMSPCCMEPNMNPQPEMFQQIGGIQTLQDVEKTDFGIKAVLASAAAWSPNPKNPPFFLDLPIKGGQAQPDVIARWAANAPLAMVHQYLPNLKKYKAIAFDAGDKDMGINDTVKSLNRILLDYGIAHTSEIYEGDHVNRIAARLETKGLPFFASSLSFEAKKRK